MKIKELNAPFIVGDVGSNLFTSQNPDDNLIMARRHIHDGAKCGLSAIKFQMFTDKELYGMEGPNRYRLPPEWLPDLAAYAATQGVEFMCTGFSPEGYNFIDAFVNVHKIASSEMKHVGILVEVAKTNKPVLISNGGAHEDEVRAITNFLFNLGKEPKDDFGFLECVANYPADPSDYNLRVLSEKVKVERQSLNSEGTEWAVVCPYVGISDHTLTNTTASTSVGLGARVFEKHFSAFDHPWGDDTIRTPDYPVSIGPIAMTQYVKDIRASFKALGTGKKVPRGTERDMTLRHRRRLKITQPTKRGDMLFFGKNFGAYRSLTEDPTAGPPEQHARFEEAVALKDLSPGDPVWDTTAQVRDI